MALFGEKKGFFGKMGQRITDAILLRPEIDEDLLDELEEILITSDMGMDTTMKIMENLRKEVRLGRLSKPSDVKKTLADIIARIVDKGQRHNLPDEYPQIILVVGINGGGKTTTIAKLAYRFQKEGKSVLLGAADTFRAAASAQLEHWGNNLGIKTILHGEGADPAAVIYDSVQAAKARGTDVLICDTAGRLQNKKNLMAELEKMNKIIDREYPEAVKETILVLDATTGKNAISQVEEFKQVTDITGIILTKMDGTAKGGIAVTIADEYDMPIKFIGVGERREDLQVFDSKAFAKEVSGE
ncbi:signal recognition particle-docking protein FtsY [Eubacteriales bacterium KG127]